MKTSKQMLESLRARLAESNSGADITLPVSLLRDMVDDALDFHKCEETLDRGFAKLMSTIDDDKATKMPASPTPLRPRPHLSIVKDPPKGGDAA